MFVLRCTRKLLGRLKVPAHPTDATPTTVLGDWYANLVVLRPQWLVIGVSDVSLLPVVLPAVPFPTLVPRFRQRVLTRLTQLDPNPTILAAEAQAMETVLVGPTASRQVLGVINDYIKLMSWWLEDEEPPSLEEVESRLSEVPFSPLQMHSSLRVTADLLRAPIPVLVKKE